MDIFHTVIIYIVNHPVIRNVQISVIYFDESMIEEEGIFKTSYKHQIRFSVLRLIITRRIFITGHRLITKY